MTDDERIMQIADRFVAMIKAGEGGDRFGDIFEALERVLIFIMSAVTSSDRRDMMEKLRNDIPWMIERADRIADKASLDKQPRH
jgi:hypothetical protein